jgi:hypothetical protein
MEQLRRKNISFSVGMANVSKSRKSKRMIKTQKKRREKSPIHPMRSKTSNSDPMGSWAGGPYLGK